MGAKSFVFSFSTNKNIQAAKDGVHVLSLSVGPSSPPSSVRLTFLNAFDVALLSAVKSGVFVVQAGGNRGPFPRTMASFSPWIMSVVAGLDDRSYTTLIYLGNGVTISGTGLARKYGFSRAQSIIYASLLFDHMQALCHTISYHSNQ
jgi:hypothetical protein